MDKPLSLVCIDHVTTEAANARQEAVVGPALHPHSLALHKGHNCLHRRSLRPVMITSQGVSHWLVIHLQVVRHALRGTGCSRRDGEFVRPVELDCEVAGGVVIAISVVKGDG